MPVFLLTFAEGLLGPNLSKFAKPLIYVVLALLILFALWGGKCAYDRHVIKNHDSALQKTANKANDAASSQRAQDTITNAKHQQETHDVIAAQPDQPISPTSLALSCQRLHHAGRDSPACRRLEGDNGAQASAH